MLPFRIQFILVMVFSFPKGIFALDLNIQTGSEMFKDTFFYNDILTAGGFTYKNHKGESRLRTNENPNDICYNSDCLIPNFELLFGLGSDLAQIVGTTERNMFVETLTNLKDRKSKNISLEELSQIMSTITGYFRSILKQDYETYFEWNSGVGSTLKACEINFEALKSSGSLIDGYKLDGIIAKCKIDIFGITSIFSSEKSKSCLNLWNEGMRLIEFDQETGSFDTFIANHFANNPHLDEQLASLYTKLEGIQKQIELCYQKNREQSVCNNPDSYTDDIKNFDIGKEAIKITGNFKDALILINVLAADPGQYAIQKKIILELRRINPSRLGSLRKYFMIGASNSFSSTLRVTKHFFGMNFQRNWSVRNYKTLAGLNIGLGLREKGFTEDEAAWFSRIVNEAYKFNTHVLHDLQSGNEVKGNKPYFVIDSSAAYTGAVLASRLYNGDEINSFATEQYQSVKEMGNSLATADWNWGMRAVGVLKAKRAVLDLPDAFKDLFQ